MTNKKQQLKVAVLVTARGLVEARKINENVVASGSFLIEEISASYELKVLSEELKALKSNIEDMESFDMTIRPIQYVKVEVMEARISVLKKRTAETKRINNIVKKAVTERVAASEVVEVVKTAVAEAATQKQYSAESVETAQVDGVEFEEVYTDAYVATFPDGFELPVFKRHNGWYASKGYGMSLEVGTLYDATIGFREHYGI